MTVIVFCSFASQIFSTPSGRVNTVVVLRCRPLLKNEKEAGAKAILSCTLSDVKIEAANLAVPSKQNRVFHFDRVFNEEASQADLYNSVVAPVVQRVLEVS